jgi:hypothetical protein
MGTDFPLNFMTPYQPHKQEVRAFVFMETDRITCPRQEEK